MIDNSTKDKLENEEQKAEQPTEADMAQNGLLGEGVRSATEIRAAVDAIYNNRNLTYSYREDVIAVLEWVLTSEPFDGLDGR